jgi:hypothetical protein
MNTKPALYKFLMIAIVIAFLGGCSSNAATSSVSTPTAAPTEDIASTLAAVSTQAVQTAVAQLTLNAPTATPVTPTSADTATPAVTPTFTSLPPTTVPTATLMPVYRVPTITPNPYGYGCAVTSGAATEGSSSTIKTGTSFTWTWVIQNTGTSMWGLHNAVIQYVSGKALQTGANAYNLTKNVYGNGFYTFKIAMTAPANASTFTAVWALVQDGITVCTMNLSVTTTK